MQYIIMAKKCSNCGNEVIECINCGRAIVEGAEIMCAEPNHFDDERCFREYYEPNFDYALAEADNESTEGDKHE